MLRVVSAGNVAGEGAKMALLSVARAGRGLALLEEVRYVELSDRADFNDHFVEQLSFPAADNAGPAGGPGPRLDVIACGALAGHVRGRSPRGAAGRSTYSPLPADAA